MESLTPAQGFDFQKPYIEAWLRFIGITDASSLIVEKTLLDNHVDTESRALANCQAQ
ncbi:hypothetical protein [Halomonas maura]|uniref:hypothetical protein n=1 Tax=Halomonas maura TaxID=117606 RepID=UPI0025B586AF|nr:hypothetical protein [Halomonas maura]MDN3556886.1 hypothetical protein [Halomonas maura]